MSDPRHDDARELALLEIRTKVVTDHHHLCSVRKTGACDCYNRVLYGDAILLLAEYDASLAREEAERARADEERQLRNTAIAEWYADAAQMENKLARCEATLEAIREGVRNPTMDYETVRISPSGLALLSAREPGKETEA